MMKSGPKSLFSREIGESQKPMHVLQYSQSMDPTMALMEWSEFKLLFDILFKKLKAIS